MNILKLSGETAVKLYRIAFNYALIISDCITY